MRHSGIKRSTGAYCQQGLTLVELIVALALGVVLVSGMTRVYLESKKNYVQDEELARLQENGRFALNILNHELKMAGFFAGAVASPVAETATFIINDCRTGWALNPGHSIDFFHEPANINASVMGDSFSGCIKSAAQIQAHTDIVSLKRSAGMPIIDNGLYTGSLNSTTTSFYLKRTGDVDPVLQYVDKPLSSSVLTTTSDTTKQVSLWRYMATIFYVRKYSVVPGDGIPALMMISLEDKTMFETTLIEGVEAFHIEFGIPAEATQGTLGAGLKSARTPVRFVANPDSAQLSAASVIRVYLLMRTRNAIRTYNDNKAYTLGSLPAITPGGHFMRRVLTTTIKLQK